VALDELESDPAAWEAPLRSQLRAADAGDSPALVTAAQELMALLDSAGSRSGKYVISIHGAQGVQVGDGNIQHNNYGSPPRR
jgi:RIP homotypic interaction motif